MAEPKAAERATGYVTGGSARSASAGLPTIVDDSALDFETVHVSAGAAGSSSSWRRPTCSRSRAAGGGGSLPPVTATGPVELHIVSDSTGETAARLVLALEAQFPDLAFEEVRHPRVESVEDLALAVARPAGGRR